MPPARRAEPRAPVDETVAIYRAVVDGVVKGVRADFEQEGTHASTLDLLQKRWEAKLVESGAFGPVVKHEDAEAAKLAEAAAAAAEKAEEISTAAKGKTNQEYARAFAEAAEKGLEETDAENTGRTEAEEKERCEQQAQEQRGNVGGSDAPAAGEKRTRDGDDGGAAKGGGKRARAEGDGGGGDGGDDGSGSDDDLLAAEFEAELEAELDAGGEDDDGAHAEVGAAAGREGAAPAAGVEAAPAGGADKDAPAGKGDTAKEAAVDSDEDGLAGLSDDDDFLNRPPSSDEDEKDPETPNMCLATYERVQRSRGTWKVTLHNGMMTVNGRDWIFSDAKGTFEWS